MKKYRINKKKLVTFIGKLVLTISFIAICIFAMIDDARVAADSKTNTGDGSYFEWSTDKQCWIEKESGINE